MDSPVDRDDPRTGVYVIDHLEPGGGLERTVEVSNGDRTSLDVRLYVADATAVDEWSVDLGPGVGDLAQWTLLEPTTVTLPPGGRQAVSVELRVPPDAFGGERLGAIIVEPVRATQSGNTSVVARVGIRMYVSVGGEQPPSADFVIETLQALRIPDGTPAVRIRVRNTGDRVLDIGGSLRLDDGPGGLSAGPFRVQVPRTLGPGGAGEVVAALDRALPAGPWRAVVDLSGGPVRRTAEATIIFPEPDEGTLEDSGAVLGPKVPAVPLDRGTLLPINLLLFLLALLLLIWFWVRERRRGSEGDGADGVVASQEKAADAAE